MNAFIISGTVVVVVLIVSVAFTNYLENKRTAIHRHEITLKELAAADTLARKDLVLAETRKAEAEGLRWSSTDSKHQKAYIANYMREAWREVQDSL